MQVMREDKPEAKEIMLRGKGVLLGSNLSGERLKRDSATNLIRMRTILLQKFFQEQVKSPEGGTFCCFGALLVDRKQGIL